MTINNNIIKAVANCLINNDLFERKISICKNSLSKKEMIIIDDIIMIYMYNNELAISKNGTMIKIQISDNNAIDMVFSTVRFHLQSGAI